MENTSRTVAKDLFILNKFPAAVRTVGDADTDSSYKSREISHDFYELIWTVKGEGWLHVPKRRKRLTIGEGQLVMIPYRIYRQYGSGEQGWHFRWLTMVGDKTPAFMELHAKPLSPVFAGPCPEKDFDLIKFYIQEGGAENMRKALGQVTSILSRVSIPDKPGGESNLTKKIREFVDRHYSSHDFNVDRLARELGLSRSHLSRSFRKENGTTLFDYIASKRLGAAMSLLENEDLPIKEIAARCGYADPDYFTRFFRERTGFTPRRLRDGVV